MGTVRGDVYEGDFDWSAGSVGGSGVCFWLRGVGVQGDQRFSGTVLRDTLEEYF